MITPIPLILDSLSKTYPNRRKAVDEVSLEVKPGEVFGLVGPNGAGKSTLLKLAAGLLHPQSGRIFCGDADVTANPMNAAKYIGLMPDPLGVYTDVSCAEYLEFYARILRIPHENIQRKITEIVGLLELGPWIDQEVETLSAGWQRRLALGRVLLSETPILLLDEPAAGLDVTARRDLLTIVQRLATEERTIIVSSHILPELEQLANRFGIINQGKWVTHGNESPFFTKQQLSDGLMSGNRWRLVCNQTDLIRSNPNLKTSLVDTPQGQGEVFFTASNQDAAAVFLKEVVKLGVDVYEFGKVKTDLTDKVLEALVEKKGVL